MPEEQTIPSHGAPVWMEIFATDLDRARSFYSAVFNWTFTDHPTQSKDEITIFSFADKPGSSLGGCITKIEEQKKGVCSPLTYFMVDDLTKARETIIANGGKEITGIEPEESGFIMRFEDCEGNRIGLFSGKQ